MASTLQIDTAPSRSRAKLFLLLQLRPPLSPGLYVWNSTRFTIYHLTILFFGLLSLAVHRSLMARTNLRIIRMVSLTSLCHSLRSPSPLQRRSPSMVQSNGRFGIASSSRTTPPSKTSFLISKRKNLISRWSVKVSVCFGAPSLERRRQAFSSSSTAYI